MAHIYYKVPTDSELGKRLQEIEKKRDKINEKCKALCEEIGTNLFCGSRNPFVFYGGFDSFVFKTPPPSIEKWKVTHFRGRSYYEPKRNSKWGKELAKRMDDMPFISVDEIKDILNPNQINGGYIFTIGLKWAKNGVFKIVYDKSKWAIPMLDDYEEITCSEYNNNE